MKAVSAHNVGKLLVYDKPKRVCRKYMASFLDCWANPVVHLFLLKSSMAREFIHLADKQPSLINYTLVLTNVNVSDLLIHGQPTFPFIRFGLKSLYKCQL